MMFGLSIYKRKKKIIILFRQFFMPNVFHQVVLCNFTLRFCCYAWKYLRFELCYYLTNKLTLSLAPHQNGLLNCHFFSWIYQTDCCRDNTSGSTSRPAQLHVVSPDSEENFKHKQDALLMTSGPLCEKQNPL